MSTITESFKQAELALAAYSNVTPGISGTPYTKALEADGAGMSPAQAEHFSEQWLVVEQYADPLSGLSATVFEEVATRQRYLAIRGTERSLPGAVMDVVADIGIFEGLNGRQQYERLESYFASLRSRNVIEAGSVTVTGHSLGGLLAQMLAVDHAGEISAAVTFNAPGLGGVGAEILDLLGIAEANIALASITNIRAEGLSPIASLGTLLGEVKEASIETSLNPIANHSIVTLTDALALYALLARIDPSLNTATDGIAKITDIVKASPNLNGNTLETAIDKPRELLLGAPGTVPEDREDYYRNRYQLTDWITARSSSGTVAALKLDALSSHGGTSIAAKARANTPDALAYRYALRELNAFALTGEASIYAGHNTAGELVASESQCVRHGEAEVANRAWRLAA